jgi:hypothetical protein
MAADGEAGPLDAVHLGALVVFALAFFPVAGPWVGESSTGPPPGRCSSPRSAATAVATLPQFGLAPVLFILTAAMAAHVVEHALGAR